MTFGGDVEVLLADLGRDAVAQRQPDGRVVVAVRPDQSFSNAVDKAREAVEKASGTAVGADMLRQLLRPYWTSRQTVDDLLAQSAAEQQRQRGEQVEDDLVPEPAEHVSVRVPLRRPDVRLAVAVTGLVLLAAGFAGGWRWEQWRATEHAGKLIVAAENAERDFHGPLAAAFQRLGVKCDDLGDGDGNATCVDTDGTTINVETLLGQKQTAYNLFYADEVLTIRKFDQTAQAHLWAQREAGALDKHEYVTGPLVLSGTDDARVHRYVRFLALQQDTPVWRYTGTGPAEIAYRPGQTWVGPPTNALTPGAG